MRSKRQQSENIVFFTIVQQLHMVVAWNFMYIQKLSESGYLMVCELRFQDHNILK